MKVTTGRLTLRQFSLLLLGFASAIAGQNLRGNDYDAFLVARYNFEDTNNPDADSSGNNNHPDSFTSGSPADTFSTDAAVGQYSRLYFGDTSFSFTQANPAYQNLSNALSGNFSVTAWVKTTNSVNNDYANAYYGAPVFFAGADYNNHCTIPLSITGSKAAFTIVSQDGPGTTTLQSASSINDGTYHFLAVTRQQSSGLMSIYVDGSLETTGTGITDPVITQGYITVAGGYNFYAGLLDDVRVYSTNLSAGDVADIDSGGNAITLATAIGAPNLDVTTSGDTSWFVEATNTDNGAPYAAQSGSVTDDQSSTLSVTVTGPGTLTFYWASQDDCNSFDDEFDLDGNYENSISCSQPWVQDGPYSIPAGQHTLTWTAYANGDEDPTEAGFLGQVSYVATALPTLTVTASPLAGTAPLTVQFTSPGVDSFGNTVTNWNWNFGDGGFSTAQSPLHTYTNAGSFSPVLMAFSTYGTTPLAVTGPGTIIVTNITLNVSVTPPYGVAPLTVQFASPGTDSGGNMVTHWQWTFGDGGTSTAQNPTHLYASMGAYTPGLTAYSTAGPLAVAGLSVINVYSNPVPAFRVLYTFSSSFGSGPNADLVLSGNTLYGTAGHGGTNGFGNVFAVNTDGTGFASLYSFAISSGAEPVGGLVLAGSTLYGPTYVGGSQSGGTVFAINTNGLDYTNLLDFYLNFTPPEADEPLAGLVLAGNALYGTTWFGGGYNHGAIFSVTTNGNNNEILHSFTTPTYNANEYAINYDGLFPSSRLIGADGTLYGTAEQGGNYGSGTIFSIVTNQPGSFNIVHYFAAVNPVNQTNGEGAFSFSGLVLSGTNLYGTAFAGGAYGNGTVFVASTNGQFFTNLYSFTGGNDGSEPHAGLTLVGKTLYGTTLYGGTSSNGTLFAIHTDGSGFTNLYNFTGGGDGANPETDLLLAGNVLYGTAASGGQAGAGTVFSFTLAQPQLAIASAGTNVVLTWSASAVGYNLEFTTNLAPPAVWSTNLPAPIILGGLNTVTNAIGPASRFYRLSQ